jgi:peptidyl-prolyl cis-trans isomerase D
MLNFIRSLAHTWIVKLLLGLLVVAFASWGIADVFISPSGKYVAKVAGVEISQADFAREFQNALNQQSQGGQKMSVQDALAQGLDAQVLDRLIFQQIVWQAATDAGIEMPEDSVIDDIRNIQIFQRSGVFDEFAFKGFLQQAQMTQEQFVDVMKADGARRTLMEALLGPIAVPDVETDLYYRYQTEKRDADFFQIVAERLPVDAPSDADVKAYYDAHHESFMAPEYRSFAVLSVSPADLQSGIEVSDADLKAAYEQSKNLYQQPEKRALAQIVVDSEDAANALKKKIDGGETFAAAAKEAGKAESDTSLGDMTEADLTAINADLAKAAFSAEKPGIVGPVKSPFGWHIIDVLKITPASTKPIDEVQDQLKADIVKERAKDKMFDLTAKIQDALSAGSALDQIATEFKAKLVNFTAIDAAGRTADGKTAENLPSQPVIDQAFATQPGAYPEMKPLEDGSYYVVRVDSVTPATLKPYDVAKADAQKDLTAERQADAAKTLAEKLKDQAAKGEDFVALAKEADTVVRQVKDVTRVGQGAPAVFGPDAVEALFNAKKGEPLALSGSSGGDYIVARVTAATAGDPAVDVAGRNQMKGILDQVFQNNVLEQLRMGLLGKYKVEAYPAIARQAVNSTPSY